MDYANEFTKPERKRMYEQARSKVGEKAVEDILRAVREKVEQRTKGGLAQLNQVFHFFDKDHSASIDVVEFCQAMESFGLQFTEMQMLAVFAVYDTNFSGDIDYTEFSNAMQAEASQGRHAVKAASIMPWEGLEPPPQEQENRQKYKHDQGRQRFDIPNGYKMNAAEAPVAQPPGSGFIASAVFAGARPGYVFQMGDNGVGYYPDRTAVKTKHRNMAPAPPVAAVAKARQAQAPQAQAPPRRLTFDKTTGTYTTKFGGGPTGLLK